MHDIDPFFHDDLRDSLGAADHAEQRFTVYGKLVMDTSDLFQLAPGDVALYGEYHASVGKMKLFMAVYEDGSKAARLYPVIRESFKPEEGYRPSKVEGPGEAWIREGLYTLVRQAEDYILLVTDAHFLNEAEEIAGPAP